MAFQNKPALNLADELDRSPSFPKGCHLIVTTSTGVYSWDSHGVAPLFRSQTRGIIAATKAGSMLAIADGRVVILHDVDKGMQKRNYRLKHSDVGVLSLFRASQSIDGYVGPGWTTSICARVCKAVLHDDSTARCTGLFSGSSRTTRHNAVSSVAAQCSRVIAVVTSLTVCIFQSANCLPDRHCALFATFPSTTRMLYLCSSRSSFSPREE